MDLFRELGALALGSRLSRLIDRLNRDISGLYRSLNVGFEARWFPVLYLLGTCSPLSVTGIANRLGISHPAVNKLVSQMSRIGFVSSSSRQVTITIAQLPLAVKPRRGTGHHHCLRWRRSAGASPRSGVPNSSRIFRQRSSASSDAEGDTFRSRPTSHLRMLAPQAGLLRRGNRKTSLEAAFCEGLSFQGGLGILGCGREPR